MDKRIRPKRIRHPLDKRGTHAFQLMAKRVIREEPICWLRLPGCTYLSTTADHVVPVSLRPDLSLVRANLRGACFHCNSARQDRPAEQARAEALPGLEWFRA